MSGGRAIGARLSVRIRGGDTIQSCRRGAANAADFVSNQPLSLTPINLDVAHFDHPKCQTPRLSSWRAGRKARRPYPFSSVTGSGVIGIARRMPIRRAGEA
jgi:hypothetical protein